VCVSICLSSKLLNGWINLYETWYVYHGTWAHLDGIVHKPFHQSVCLHVYPFLSLLGSGSGMCLSSRFLVTNTRNSRRIVGGVILYAVRVLSNESLCVCLPITLLLLGNGSVNTFLRQGRIVGGVVFYAVRFVSNDSNCFPS
jgi:hypothetical protein